MLRRGDVTDEVPLVSILFIAKTDSSNLDGNLSIFWPAEIRENVWTKVANFGPGYFISAESEFIGSILPHPESS